jgi:hypothetical protein
VTKFRHGDDGTIQRQRGPGLLGPCRLAVLVVVTTIACAVFGISIKSTAKNLAGLAGLIIFLDYAPSSATSCLG